MDVFAYEYIHIIKSKGSIDLVEYNRALLNLRFVMNFGLTQIATSSSINPNVKKSVTSSSITPASANDRNDFNNFIPSAKTQNLSNKDFNSNQNKEKCFTNLSETFRTPQNSFEVLSSIQNCKIPSDCGSCESLSATISKTAIVALPSQKSLAPNVSLKELSTLSPVEVILPENPTNQHGSSRPINTTLLSIANGVSDAVNTFEHGNLTTHQSRELLESAAETNQDIGLRDNVNDLKLRAGEISIDSCKVLGCDEDSLSKSSENSRDVLRSAGLTDCVDKAKNVSRLSERAKNKSWYNLLYPNYKSRSQDFKKLFKEVPNDERLIVDYSCALFRDLLIQGRLYISQNYVCFHANILGWETCLTIKWNEVTSITKEKTALVIPNAISICTQKEQFFFSSFATRDKTFLILFRVWQNTLMNKPMPAQEIWQLVHNYYGDELGLTSDDEDYIDPTVEHQEDNTSNSDFVSSINNSSTNSSNNFEGEKEQSSVDIYKPTVTSSGKNIGTMRTNAKELTLISAKPEDGISPNPQAEQSLASGTDSKNASTTIASENTVPKELKHNTSTFDSKRKMSKLSRHREEYANKNSEALPTDVSDSSDSEENNIPFIATAECNSPHEGRQLVHTILPINIETLFKLLFSKSKFLLDFHAMRKSTDLVFSEWTMGEDGQQTRTFNVTVQLAASVGPKTSKVTEFQLMRDCSKPGELYSIDINNVNAGIPYADSFSVLVHYCLVKTVDDHTMLSVHAQIKYKKSIWGVVKGFIEKNTWAGLDDFYTSLLHSLQSETCIPPAKGKGRRPRRGTAVHIRPMEEIPIFQTNPETTELPCIAQAISTRHSTEYPIIAAEATIKFRWLSLFVLFLLCFLIIVNVILLLKLWRLEERIEEDMSASSRTPKLSVFKQLPKSHEDWIELLRHQEVLHETELKKWQTVLQTAIELLKKVSVVCQNIIQNDKLMQKIGEINDEL